MRTRAAFPEGVTSQGPVLVFEAMNEPTPPFTKASPLVDFPAEERKILEFWREHDVFKATQALRKDAPSFVFYEGPPTANGMPHNGHVLTRVVKDVFPRYKTMRGFYVPRKAGWDTHGLPVEIEVEKELRIRGREGIEQFGVEKFVRRCIDSVFKYTKEWNELTEKLAFWVDLDDPYVTFHESYVQSVWWALAQLHEKGLLYQGHKVLWWWAQGGTALSAAEVNDGYRDVQDPSVYVRFPLVDRPDTSLVVWTTTPWTLPSNMFAAVGAKLDYVEVEHEGHTLIVAKNLLESVSSKLLGKPKKKKAPQPLLEVKAELKGAELVGKRYTPPFAWFEGEERIWTVHAADFADDKAGTGIVHVAPAFGEDDHRLFQQILREQPGIELLCAIEPAGGYRADVAPEQYVGMWVKDADKPLTRELKERGLLLHAEQYKHTYPFCPRSDQDPLIQLARPAWYIRTTERIQDAIQNNKQIQWFPETIRDGRFGNFLESNVDWALSRERFWGTPLNVWINDETGAIDMPTSAAEILERNPAAFAHWEAAKAADPSLPEHLRVHKPWIDEVSWTKPGEPGVYRRVPEVIDCWFDSGSMPFAQWGYPHQGKDQFEVCFPADFISEAIDQTRGWFYSLLMISTLLFEEQQQPHPYKTCVVLGHVCDREGKKESKSKGNYTPPEVILDCVRLQFAVKTSDTVPQGEVRINHDDYLGLDLEVNNEERMWVYRGDAAHEDGQDAWVVHADKTLPRRIALVHPETATALAVTPLAEDATIMAKEVPSLEPASTLWLEDPTSKAPGADAFRWFFFASNPPWNQTRHSLSAVRTIQRELPLKLRNVYAFFTIYANIDGFSPEDAACLAGKRPAKQRALLDRWALSELNLLVRRVTEHLDGYRLYEATQELTAFVDGLSNWYVRRSRDRFWAAGLEQDKLDAHWTLYECLVTSSQLLAPFLPFVTEEIWQNLVVGHRAGAPMSVHMSDFPSVDEAAIDAELSEVMNLVRGLVSLGLQVRTQNVLKVRQPLSEAELVLTDPEQRAAVEAHAGLIADELNVKQVAFVDDAGAFVTYEVKPFFPRLGPRVGKAMPALKKALAQADGGAILAALDADGKYVVDAGGTPVELTSDDVQVALTAKEGFAAASGKAGVVVLTTTLTPELLADGHFREVLHHVQTVRKDLDLDYTARIEVTLNGAETPLAAVRGREEALGKEVLATTVSVGQDPADGMHVHACTVSGEELTIGVRLAP